MGGRGSSSGLSKHGGGGVPGVNGGGKSGTAVGGGSQGGSAGDHGQKFSGPNAQQPSKDQRGQENLNGMTGSSAGSDRTPRDHIDGNNLTDEQKLRLAMMDTGWSEEKAGTFAGLVEYYSDGNSKEFCGSGDMAQRPYGDRPDDSQLISEGILRGHPYEGDLWRGITIDAGAAQDWFDETRTGDIFGFSGYYTGKDEVPAFYTWQPGDMRDAGVLASFSSDYNLAVQDYAKLKLNEKGVITGAKDERWPKTASNTTLIFHLIDNKTAGSITHLAISGADEHEVLSPIWQQFEYAGRRLIRTLPNGHEVWEITIKDAGVKPKDKGPVR